MAAFGGLELLSNFKAVFTFLFMFAVTYGVLSGIKMFGDKGKTVNPIIAFAVAILSTFSGFMVELLGKMSPMFVILMFALFFILVLLKFLGVDDSMIGNFFNGENKQKKTLVYWIIILVLVLVVIIPVSIQFGDNVGPYVNGENSSSTGSNLSYETTSSGNPNTATNSFSQNFGATLFHPKVVGAFLIILLASLAIRQLSLEE